MNKKVKEEKKITLADIAGYDEEKAEILKIVKLLNNYKAYSAQGIYIPKGLILQGPPGCGKTLLAKAIAGECDIPFFSYSPSEDGDDVLGGLKRIFKAAKEHTPSIVYIDEINEIVTNRRYTSDVTRKALQFLLTRLDGFDSHTGTLVIASTNCYDDLPRSLLRSGRMDKKIKIDLPNLPSRIAIVEHYTKNFEIFSTLNTKSLAVKLKGMSGSDIKTLINNALIEYIDEKDKIVVEDFAKLIASMHFETIGKRWSSKEVVTKILAHEVGHSLVGYILQGDHGSISAIKYDGVAGFTSFGEMIETEEDEEKQEIMSKSVLLDEICVSLGGMAGELICYGEYDSGVNGDISHCEKLFDYGLESTLFGFEMLQPYWRGDNTDKFKNTYKKVRDKIFNAQLKRAKKIIKKNYGLCRFLIDKALENSDVLTEKQIDEIIKEYNGNKKVIDKTYKHSRLSLEGVSENE